MSIQTATDTLPQLLEETIYRNPTIKNRSGRAFFFKLDRIIHNLRSNQLKLHIQSLHISRMRAKDPVMPYKQDDPTDDADTVTAIDYTDEESEQNEDDYDSVPTEPIIYIDNPSGNSRGSR